MNTVFLALWGQHLGPFRCSSSMCYLEATRCIGSLQREYSQFITEVDCPQQTFAARWARRLMRVAGPRQGDERTARAHQVWCPAPRGRWPVPPSSIAADAVAPSRESVSSSTAGTVQRECGIKPRRVDPAIRISLAGPCQILRMARCAVRRSAEPQDPAAPSGLEVLWVMEVSARPLADSSGTAGSDPEYGQSEAAGKFGTGQGFMRHRVASSRIAPCRIPTRPRRCRCWLLARM